MYAVELRLSVLSQRRAAIPDIFRRSAGKAGAGAGADKEHLAPSVVPSAV